MKIPFYTERDFLLIPDAELLIQPRFFFLSNPCGVNDDGYLGVIRQFRFKLIKYSLTKCYTFIILYIMKTAISIPDKLFTDAEITAKQLGLARSQLYVKAITEFIEHYNKDKITEKLNLFYKSELADSELLNVGLHSLREATINDVW